MNPCSGRTAERRGCRHNLILNALRYGGDRRQPHRSRSRGAHCRQRPAQWRTAAGLRMRARRPASVKYTVAGMGRSRSGPTVASPAPPRRWQGKQLAMKATCPRRAGASSGRRASRQAYPPSSSPCCAPWVPSRPDRLHQFDDAVPADQHRQPVTGVAEWCNHHLLVLAFPRLFVGQT
jgi:hypothetical protein